MSSPKMPSRSALSMPFTVALIALDACGGSPAPATTTTTTTTSTTASGSGGTATTAAAGNPCAAHNPCAVRSTTVDGATPPYAECIGACSRIHAPGAEGAIDIEAVANTLRHEARSLRECFVRVERHHPGLRGRVDVRFTVGTNGRVSGAPVVTGLDEAPEVGTCMASRVRYINFPHADGGPAQVSFPFTFQPGT